MEFIKSEIGIKENLKRKILAPNTFSSHVHIPLSIISVFILVKIINSSLTVGLAS